MGWTSYEARRFLKSGRVDRKAECDHYFDYAEDLTVLKSAMVGSTYYAAVQKDDYVFGCVFLTQVHDGEFYYKELSELAGPVESRCPESILDLLSDTDNEYALGWRERCREHARRRKEHQTISTLPIGAKIRYALHDGRQVVLQKMAPAYQFKTPWWYNAENNTYIKKKCIPEKFEIVSQ